MSHYVPLCQLQDFFWLIMQTIGIPKIGNVMILFKDFCDKICWLRLLNITFIHSFT